MAYGKPILRNQWLIPVLFLAGMLLGTVYQYRNYVRPLTLEEQAIRWWQGRTG